jgi:Sigma-70, region 4/Protein of unknown function (DUF1634)
MNCTTPGSAQLESLLAGTLHYGTSLASAVIGLGLGLGLIESRFSVPKLAILRDMRIVNIGIALFILLPIVRVIVMFIVYLRQRDYPLAAIALLVLTIILLGFTVGLAGSRHRDAPTSPMQSRAIPVRSIPAKPVGSGSGPGTACLTTCSYTAAASPMRNLDWRRLRTDYESDSEGYPRSDLKERPEISSTALDRPEIREALVKALQSLALENREVFVAHDVHGLSLKETCAVLGLSAGTVRARLRRARFSLSEILARDLRPPGSSERRQNR